ncbi:MAG: glycosyltransferase family 4 protein [Rhodoferax sp.]|nr:glycosyltransferase family 4 protein [Rhodoferax sp.]
MKIKLKLKHAGSALSEKHEVAEIQSFDIGIMPLPDAPFERGKCGYKLLQYMACGKPVIASAVGANTDIVVPGKNGILANTAAEWTSALYQLIDDEQLRADLGANGRRMVEDGFALNRLRRRFATVSLIEQPSQRCAHITTDHLSHECHHKDQSKGASTPPENSICIDCFF